MEFVEGRTGAGPDPGSSVAGIRSIAKLGTLGFRLVLEQPRDMSIYAVFRIGFAPAASLNSRIISRLNAGMSSGLRLVTKL